jgi:hypothetical protein
MQLTGQSSTHILQAMHFFRKKEGVSFFADGMGGFS